MSEPNQSAGSESNPSPRPGARERGRMRRRLREQRRVREALLLDLGALVFELHRHGRREPELLQAKASELSRVDAEVRGLTEALEQDLGVVELVAAGIAGTCENCGGLLSTDARFCGTCGAAAKPGIAPTGQAPAAGPGPSREIEGDLRQEPAPQEVDGLYETAEFEPEDDFGPEPEPLPDPEPVPEPEFEPDPAGADAEPQDPEAHREQAIYAEMADEEDAPPLAGAAPPPPPPPPGSEPSPWEDEEEEIEDPAASQPEAPEEPAAARAPWLDDAPPEPVRVKRRMSRLERTLRGKRGGDG